MLLTPKEANLLISHREVNKMRRMYSEKELTDIIKVVFEEELESGALDESISDAVDAYLVENPVDITALEGKTIAPAVVNATTSMSAPSGTFTSLNGESTPSVKPIYYHPFYMSGQKNGANVVRLQIAILDNNPTAYNSTTGIAKIKQLLNSGAIINANGYYVDNNEYCPIYLLNQSAGDDLIYYHTTSARKEVLFDSIDEWGLTDGVNKIN